MAFQPPYLLGVSAGNLGRWSEARDDLRRALERDGTALEVWSRLGIAFERLGDTASLEELRRRYHDRFGIPLVSEW